MFSDNKIVWIAGAGAAITVAAAAYYFI